MHESAAQTARHAPPAAPDNRLAWLLLIGGLAGAVVMAVIYCFFGTTVYDEGGYAYEGWLVVAHGWVPYRDFFTKVTPLIFYIYGIGQALFGPGLLVARITAILFALAGLGLGMIVARRLGGKWAAVATAWFFLPSLAPVAAQYQAFAISICAFFIMLALFFLTMPRARPLWLYLAGAAAALLVLSRHDLIFPALVIWVYMLWVYPAPLRHRIGAVAGSFALIGLVMLPFLIIATDELLRILTIGRVGRVDMGRGTYGTAARANIFSFSWHLWMVLRYYGLLIIVAVPCAAWLIARARAQGLGLKPMLRRNAMLLLVPAVGLANWLGRVVGAIVLNMNIFYLLDFYMYLPLVVFAAVLFARVLARSGPLGFRPYHVALVIVAFFMVPLLAGKGAHARLSFSLPTDLQRAQIGGEFIARHTTAEDTIFTIADPHIFLEAGRILPSQLGHQLFGYRIGGDTATVEARHFFNDDTIRRWLSGDADVAVMSAGTVEFLRGERNPDGEQLYAMIMELLAKNYDLVAEEPLAYGGVTTLYRLRPDASGDARD